jgi:outer membrane protein assembly factor BamB
MGPAPRGRCLAGIGVLAAAMLAAGNAHAWTTRIRGAAAADLLALDETGNVVTTVPVAAGRYGSTTAIVKLAARSGQEVWRRSLRVPGREHSDFAHVLRTMAGGDVVVAGGVEVDGQVEFTVLRLAGSNGRVRWRRAVHGADRPNGYGEARAAAIDAAGDVVAAGFVESALALQYHGTSDFAVVKLAGDDGSERWRFVFDGPAHEYDEATAVAADAAGDVIAAGTTYDPQALNTITLLVVKLSHADGHLVWQRRLDDAWRVSAIALNPADDALLAVGTTDDDFGVVKLSGVTGAPLWEARVSGSEHRWEEAFDVRVLPSGGVTAAGMTADAAGAMSFTAVSVDDATGQPRWQRFARGTQGYGFARRIALAPNGDVVVGGEVRNDGSCYDVAVDRLSATSGDVLATRLIDGRTQATTCERTDCGEGRCPPSRAGADRDALSAVMVDASGRTVVTGALSDGRFGRSHGFAATFPLVP